MADEIEDDVVDTDENGDLEQLEDDEVPGDDEELELEEEVVDPPAFSSELTSVAKQFGMTDEEIAEFPSEKALHSALTAMDRTTMTVLRGLQEKAAALPPKGEATPAQEKAREKLFQKYALELDPESWDADTIKLFTGMNDHFGSQLEKLEQELSKRDEQVSAIVNWAQLQEAKRAEETIDEWFQELSEDYSDLFGKGSLDDLAPTAEAANNRRKLVQEALAYGNVDVQLGRTPGSLKANLRRALNARHQEKTVQVAKREISREAQAKRGKAIAKPGGSQKPAKAPRQAAVDFVNKKFKQLGLSVDSGDEDGDVLD